MADDVFFYSLFLFFLNLFLFKFLFQASNSYVMSKNVPFFFLKKVKKRTYCWQHYGNEKQEILSIYFIHIQMVDDKFGQCIFKWNKMANVFLNEIVLGLKKIHFKINECFWCIISAILYVNEWKMRVICCDSVSWILFFYWDAFSLYSTQELNLLKSHFRIINL